MRFYIRVWLFLMFVTFTVGPALALGFAVAGGRLNVLINALGSSLLLLIGAFALIFTLIAILVTLTDLPAGSHQVD
ncbi:hypothetical protein [Sphingobium indicum]